MKNRYIQLVLVVCIMMLVGMASPTTAEASWDFTFTVPVTLINLPINFLTNGDGTDLMVIVEVYNAKNQLAGIGSSFVTPQINGTPTFSYSGNVTVNVNMSSPYHKADAKTYKAFLVIPGTNLSDNVPSSVLAQYLNVSQSEVVVSGTIQ